MNKNDKICKEVLDVHKFCKEQTTRNLVLETSSGNLNLSEESLRQVVKVVEQSLDVSFERVFEGFQKTVYSLDASENNVTKKTSKIK